jgi:hypothetical protein
MNEAFGPATLAAGQSLSAFTTFLPPLSSVRKASKEDDTSIVGDVRMGEVAATAIAFGIGAITSSLSGSAVPMYAAAFMAIVVIVIYEMALSGDRPFEPLKQAHETLVVRDDA